MMELGSALESERPATVYGRGEVLTSSVHGDIVVATSEGLKYGSVLRESSKLSAMGGLRGLDVVSVSMNLAGDAVCIASRDWVSVCFVPRRVDGVVPDDVEWQEIKLEAETAIEACAWQAYADDHVMVLTCQGSLRLWAAAEDGQLAAEVCLSQNSGKAVDRGCFGSAWGWSRLATFALVGGQLVSVCPLCPRRAAAPTSAVCRMRTEALRLEDPEARTAACDWLDTVCPELADIDNDQIRLDDHGFLTLRAGRKGIDEPQAVVVPETSHVVALANLDSELIGSAAFLALAYEDGRIELCLFQDLVLPRFIGRGSLPRPKYCVLESLLLDGSSPTNGISSHHLNYCTESGALVYTSDNMAALVDVNWLETVDEALRKSGRLSRELVDAQPSAVRHLIKSNDQAQIVGTTMITERGGGTYLLAWLSDASALSVNIGAARLFLAERAVITSASFDQDQDQESILELPLLASDLAKQVLQARRELDKVPTVLIGSTTEHETTLALQATREALENKVALPLADAARCAEALTKLLKAARSVQAQAAKDITDSTKSAASRSNQLSELAEACHDRGLHLAARARDLAEAANGLQPRLGKADRDFKSKLTSMDLQARRAQANIAQLDAKCKQIDAHQATQPPLRLDGHFRTITKALANQADLLAQLATSLNTLRTSLDSSLQNGGEQQLSSSFSNGTHNVHLTNMNNSSGPPSSHHPTPIRRRSNNSSLLLLAPSSSAHHTTTVVGTPLKTPYISQK